MNPTQPAWHEDAGDDFRQNFAPLDAEVARLTGSRQDFTHDEVVGFFHRCVDAEGRRDYLIIAPAGRIIGESVINEMPRKPAAPTTAWPSSMATGAGRASAPGPSALRWITPLPR